ncbi:MAG: PAS domain S-box protein, partial [bacterium]|nr:PAS domain S-box protein [bacterium]
GKIDFCPLPLRTKGGKVVHVETSVAAGSWKGAPAIFCTFLDITARREAEQRQNRALNRAETAERNLSDLLKATTAIQMAESEKEVLDIVARAVYESGWGSVAAHLFDDWQVVESSFVGLQDKEIRIIQKSMLTPQQRAAMYGPSLQQFVVSRSYFIPAELRLENEVPPIVRKSRVHGEGPENWQADDAAYVPMYGPFGEIVGAFCMDDPVDEKRPTIKTFEYMEFFADLAAVTIHKIRLAAEREKAEEALRQSERRLRQAQELSQIGSWSWDLVTNRRVWSDELYRIMEIDPSEELTNETVRRLIHPDDLQAYDQSLKEAYEGKSKWSTRRRYVMPDGRMKYIQLSTQTERDVNGNLIGMTGAIREVTESVLIFQQLEESEAKYRSLVEQASDGIAITQDRRICFVNSQLAGFLGFAVEELEGQDFIEFIAPSERDRIINIYKSRSEKLDGPDLYETRCCHREGHDIDIEVSSSLISYGGEPAMLSFIRDLSKRKQTERELVEKEELLSATIESTADGILVVDETGKVKYANHRFMEMWKIPEELVRSRDDGKLLDFVLSQLADPQAFITEVHRLYNTDEKSLDELQFQDGRIFERFSAPLLHNQQVVGRVWSFRDMTSRVQDQRALEESERKNRTLLNALPDLLFVVRRDGTIVSHRSHATDLSLDPTLSFVGKTLSEYLPASLAEKAMAAANEAFRSRSVIKLEYSLPIKDQTKEFEARVVAFGDDEVLFVIRDITETKRLRELKSRAQRLETAGSIAGQVAHDFNNLLGPLMAYPDLIRELLPDSHESLEFLDSIEKAAKQMADINQQLLTLGRRGHYNQEPIDLNEIVRDVFSDFPRAYGTIEFDIDLADDLMNMIGGSAQIHRVVSNLLTNAIDAVKKAGKISIKTQNFYLDELKTTYSQIPRGEYVKLTVTDSGCGIAQEMVGSIFEPFFTSKTVNKERGSGLGLSVVDGVVKDHHGHIDLSTQVGKGTSFYLYFPITREETPEIVPGKIPTGNEKVLVVDDDDFQREVTCRLLSKLGYQAQAVESGEQAVEFMKSNSQDLVVLDMVMPLGIDGAETYRRIIENNPGQRAIVASGFSETDRVLEAQKLGAGAFVKKPLCLQSLAAAVRLELDRPVPVTRN